MVKFSPAFKTWLKTEADKYQCEESDTSPYGYLTFEEWMLIWEKACEQFKDASLGDEESDEKWAQMVR